MKANEVTLNSFLSQTKTQFIIPVYQRNYDWAEIQCRQLFNDIIEIGNKSGETHFIGSIVFIHEGIYTSSDVKQLVVIDGQQRLTTFSLLYLALFKFAIGNGLEDKGTEINETYIVNKFVKEDSSKLKLKQSDLNAKAFKFLLSDNDPANYGEFSRLIENYIFFKNSINYDNFATVLNGLNYLLFVEISLERGKDDPQKIFESLNSTGLELSQADLIRNYILMGLEPKEQVRIFNNFWDIIEKNAKDNDKEESRVSDFIRDYLTYTTKKIPNKNKVYEEFKERYKDRNQTFYQETLQEIKDFSFHYAKLLNPRKETSEELRRQIDYVKRLEINISFPFLLPVYNDYASNIISKEVLESILKLVQSFVWRRFVTNLPTNALNKIFMTLYNDVDKANYLYSIQLNLLRKKGVQKFPTDKDIEIALEEKDVYNTQSKNRIYFLELLENHNNREYVSVDNPDITIEHIFPQSPDELWFNKLDEKSISLMQDKYLNTIANLTLSGNNGSLSNKYFTDKKTMNRDNKQQGYSFSRLWLNQYLKEIDSWDINSLKERYKILLNRFYQIWEFPKIEIEEEIDTDQDYTIYNAPNPRFKKLDYFIFKEEKVVTDEVSKMYYHVIKQLFEENPSVFQHQDVKSLLGISTNGNDLRSPYPISSGHFIEANIDNNSKFRRLKTLLGKFDYEEELLINFSDIDLDDADVEVKDREYWIERTGKEGVEIVDECLRILNEIDLDLMLNFNQSYIGISHGGKVNNFIVFIPKQAFARAEILVRNVDSWVERLKNRNFKIVSIGKNTGRLKFRIDRKNILSDSKMLHDMFNESFKSWME